MPRLLSAAAWLPLLAVGCLLSSWACARQLPLELREAAARHGCREYADYNYYSASIGVKASWYVYGYLDGSQRHKADSAVFFCERIVPDTDDRRANEMLIVYVKPGVAFGCPTLVDTGQSGGGSLSLHRPNKDDSLAGFEYLDTGEPGPDLAGLQGTFIFVRGGSYGPTYYCHEGRWLRSWVD